MRGGKIVSVSSANVVQGVRKRADEENGACPLAESSQEWAIKRTVALAGATGLVGRSLLEGLLADTSVQSVHVLGRRKPRAAHARITFHIVDFSNLQPLPPVDEVYLASAPQSRLPEARLPSAPSISTRT